jgi:hypothetical protein
MGTTLKKNKLKASYAIPYGDVHNILSSGYIITFHAIAKVP